MRWKEARVKCLSVSDMRTCPLHSRLVNWLKSSNWSIDERVSENKQHCLTYIVCSSSFGLTSFLEIYSVFRNMLGKIYFVFFSSFLGGQLLNNIEPLLFSPQLDFDWACEWVRQLILTLEQKCQWRLEESSCDKHKSCSKQRVVIEPLTLLTRELNC